MTHALDRLALNKTARAVLRFACAIATTFLVISAAAQTKSYERSFPQSKGEIERAIAKMQSALSGHLPVLEGFADAGDHPLDGYRRGFYQAEVQVNSAANGSSVVRITAKVTAWYNDPAGARSGYQLLPSNGRIESDLLDQLAEQLAGVSPRSESDTVVVNTPPTPAPVTPTLPVTAPPVAPASPAKLAAQPATSQPVASRAAAPQPPASTADAAISAPSRQFPETSSSLSQGLASSLEHSSGNAATNDRNLATANSALEAEAESLKEVLKNQAHPKNLVAVKKSGTPVVSTPSLTAKPEFLASQHDEFELLNFNADWVHVRISGLSRGWIWRNSVEMPEGIPDTEAAPVAAMKPVADLFRVTREENVQFPGDWPPLRGKNVKILTVQRTDDNAANAGGAPNDGAGDKAKERLDYTRFLLEKTYSEMAAKPQGLAGIVVIFDSIDGGMIAAPVDTLQQWKAGALSDAALWHKCFFDPPELFDSTTAARGQ
jgi:hypothetical protein